MGLLLKRTSKTRQSFTKDSRIVTKAFDLGDPSMTKKFSAVNISYKMQGAGTSDVVIRYKVDNDSNWGAVTGFTNNEWSFGNALKKTSGKVKTASFRFPNKTIGRKVAIKIQHNGSSNAIGNFEIVDISFTFRAITRK